MSKPVFYTEEGLEKLRAELKHLITVERPAISELIAEARDKGDLSENAEYDAAKDAQAMLEMKISQLQDLISNARLIDKSRLDPNKVQLLATVTINNLTSKSKVTYTIVPESEANIREKKISVNSPIAKGLLGKSVGEKVEVTVPAGILKLEVLEIKYNH